MWVRHGQLRYPKKESRIPSGLIFPPVDQPSSSIWTGFNLPGFDRSSGITRKHRNSMLFCLRQTHLDVWKPLEFIWLQWCGFSDSNKKKIHKKSKSSNKKKFIKKNCMKEIRKCCPRTFRRFGCVFRLELSFFKVLVICGPWGVMPVRKISKTTKWWGGQFCQRWKISFLPQKCFSCLDLIYVGFC